MFNNQNNKKINKMSLNFLKREKFSLINKNLKLKKMTKYYTSNFKNND